MVLASTNRAWKARLGSGSIWLGITGLFILVLCLAAGGVAHADEWPETDDEYWGDSYASGYYTPSWNYSYSDLSAMPSDGEAPLTVSFIYTGFPAGSVLEWGGWVEDNGYTSFDSYSYRSYGSYNSGSGYYSGYGYPSFSHTFTQPGSYRVSVSLYGLKPGEEEEYWDNTYYTDLPFRHSSLAVLDSASTTVYVRASSDSSWPAGNSWTLKSVYDYAWPELELSVTQTGSGPWDVVYNAQCTMPLEFIREFAWDLNNDGIFSRTSGRNDTLTRQLKLPGWYTIGVRVTDIRGYSTETTATFALGVD